MYQKSSYSNCNTQSQGALPASDLVIDGLNINGSSRLNVKKEMNNGSHIDFSNLIYPTGLTKTSSQAEIKSRVHIDNSSFDRNNISTPLTDAINTLESVQHERVATGMFKSYSERIIPANSNVASIDRPSLSPPKPWLVPGSPISSGKKSNGNSPKNKVDEIIVIHICDEARNVNKNFYCKRRLLVTHMKYFDSLLKDSDNKFEDIDISVHCDVEIFEWLMTYIHNIDPPALDTKNVISILISSEFLQIDSLVDTCTSFISNHLNEIVRLPVDFSCLSDRILHKLASLISPKILIQIKDKKDKILNKLYKKRVEIDFSRKSPSLRNSNSTSASMFPSKSIASSLTCCQHCGIIYLDTYSSSLQCPLAPISIDFRGRLEKRHRSVSTFSLTNYLKSLHSANMSWEAIYWHVWAACTVFRRYDYVVSALETDKFVISEKAIVLKRVFTEDEMSLWSDSNLSAEEGSSQSKDYIIHVSSSLISPATANITSSLNPSRKPEVLTEEIYELLSSQINCISSPDNIKIIDATKSAMCTATESSASFSSLQLFDFCNAIYGEADRQNGVLMSRKGVNSNFIEIGRGRSLSPKSRTSTSRDRYKNKLKSNDISVDTFGDHISVDQRSAGASTRRPRSSKASGSIKSKKKLDSNDPIPNMNRDIDLTLRSIPGDIVTKIQSSTDFYKGVWIHPSHPLQLHPTSYYDVIGQVYAAMSNLSGNMISAEINVQEDETDLKRLEWLLDVVREFDDKRADKYTNYLKSIRQQSSDFQSNTWMNKAMKQIYQLRKKAGTIATSLDLASVSNGEYYKDKSRKILRGQK